MCFCLSLYLAIYRVAYYYMLSIKHNYPQHLDISLQEQALTRWKNGGLVVLPTETVYGLGADATNGEAVAAIYALKSRPRFNPLIIHVASAEMARRYVQWNDRAETLSQFWPGPLTLVLKHTGGIADIVLSGGDTVAVRVPRHPYARSLLAAYGAPIAAPSANRSGRISPTTAQHVRDEFGDACPLVIDGGACEVGVESTVVDVSGNLPRLLRHGSITREMLEAALNIKVLTSTSAESGAARASPGMLASHYAPSKPLRLNANSVGAREGLLAFGVPECDYDVMVQLSETQNLEHAAANLFAGMRTLDANPEIDAIAVMPIPNLGVGEAINDRLQRAAAPRIDV
jgi:L-threonylcarbamoyladenylate synthase